jgi:hypothetical protein
MFSKGLPLPVDVFLAASELVVDEAACGCCCACVEAGEETWAVELGAAEDGEPVVLVSPSRVDVTVFPKLIVLGPIITGTISCNVFPLPSVIVLVIVEVNIPVSCWSPSFLVVFGLSDFSEC